MSFLGPAFGLIGSQLATKAPPAFMHVSRTGQFGQALRGFLPSGQFGIGYTGGLILAMVLLTHGILLVYTNLNTSTTNKILEWLMACRVMVLTEGETTGNAAIDDMDAIPVSLVTDADVLTTEGAITNAL
jgi:hypothetical protein